MNEIFPEYDQYLDEYVYSKIGSELSELDKKNVTEMSLGRETQVKALRERLDMKSELLNVRAWCLFHAPQHNLPHMLSGKFRHLFQFLP